MSDKVQLDAKDLQILELLQSDGSLSHHQIAERVGLSTSPCSRRIRRMEEQGIILGTYVQLRAKALNIDLTALISISMDKHTPDRYENLEKVLLQYPEVQELYIITGREADCQIKVMVPDMDYYHRFLLEKITTIKGVSGVHSSFVLKKAINTTKVPLKYVKVD